MSKRIFKLFFITNMKKKMKIENENDEILFKVLFFVYRREVFAQNNITSRNRYVCLCTQILDVYLLHAWMCKKSW